MDCTLENDSDIPFLPITEDIPVHSTPIKGKKVPLPSTKHMLMKAYNKNLLKQDDYIDFVSLQSIKHSDIQSLDQENGYVIKGQYHNNTQKHVEQGKRDTKSKQDLSNVNNMRQKHQIREQAKDFPVGYQRPVQVKLTKTQEQMSIQNAITTGNKVVGMATTDMQIQNNSVSVDAIALNSLSAEVIMQNRGTNLYSENHAKSHYASHADACYSNKPLILTREMHTYINDGCDNVGKMSNGQQTMMSSSSVRIEASTRCKNDFNDETPAGEEIHRLKTHSPRIVNSQNTLTSRSLSSTKQVQNNSLSELENTMIHKQRQEIQLLMSELKDRDRELSDLVTAHQQQLTAWQQDKDRLQSLEKKCTHYENELHAKTVELQQTITNLRNTKTESRKDQENVRLIVERLTKENNNNKDGLERFKVTNACLQDKINELLTAVGKLQSREEELTTCLQMKEKDIASATSRMKELCEHLQKLDFQCKEFQDKEKEALKEKNEWKQLYDNSRAEVKTLYAELDNKKKESIQLCEENRSARQQLHILQKEANLTETCKDEVIESMKIKQDRTDSQLKNIRELYERQLKEVARLQMQLDTSKELIQRQHYTTFEQQLSGSYHTNRNSQMSEVTLEHGSASQRQNISDHHRLSSPTQHMRSRETESDIHGFHHTQSSGYQSQLSDNQTVSGNQPLSHHRNDCSKSSQQLLKQSIVLNVNSKSMSDSQHKPQTVGYQDNDKTLNKLITSNSSLKHACDGHSVSSELNLYHHSSQDNYKTTGIKTTNACQSNCKNAFSDLLTFTPNAFEQLENQKSHGDILNTELCYEQSKSVQLDECMVNSVDTDKHIGEGVVANIRLPVIDISIDRHNIDDVLEPSSTQHRVIVSQFLPKEHTNNTSTNMDEQNKMYLRQCSSKPPVVSDSDHSTNVTKYGMSELQTQGIQNSYTCAMSDRHSQKLQTYENPSLNEETELVAFKMKYTFENKLFSFLEDTDDLDDSLWNDKPATESSPASKLQRLLVESEQMVQNLEKTTVPKS